VTFIRVDVSRISHRWETRLIYGSSRFGFTQVALGAY
jgi:hypothetical protein